MVYTVANRPAACIMHACFDAYWYMVALYADRNHFCWSTHLLFILYKLHA